jgi:hypothetical protein
MKKTNLVLALTASLFATQAATAGEWNFLAGTKDGYKAEPIVSVMAGSMDVDGESGTITGVEVSLNCPLVQPPSNRIRQQASITSYDEGGVSVTNFEINPHYVVEVAPNLEVGGGPGFGYMMSDDVPDQLGFQLGASAQMTTPADSDASGDADNSRFAVKVGYAF